MTKLAMLIGAKPRNGHIGPIVRFESGCYRVRFDNVKDSQILLCNATGHLGHMADGVDYQLTGGDYFCHVISGGSENYINVSLEKVA